MKTLHGAVVLTSLALVACGPSLKAAVESDMRFEHCYRIDEDPSTPIPNKRGCWKEWTARYTRGQARERVSYAKERVRVLDGAIATPMAAAQPSAVACPPSPANPYSPPPKTTPKEAVTEANQACSETCTKAWNACAKPCTAEATCVLSCDEKFRMCVKTCL